jgi:hypothetical protein
MIGVLRIYAGGCGASHMFQLVRWRFTAHSYKRPDLNVVIFLDVTFDLNNAKHKPYRKPNDDPLHYKTITYGYQQTHFTSLIGRTNI